MASMILSRYDKNKDFKLDLAESGLDEATFKKLDRDGDGFLTLTETMHWAEVAQPVSVELRIGKVKGNQPQVAVTTPTAKLPKGVQVGKAAPGLAYLLLDEAKLSFHGVASPQQMMMNKFNGPGGYYYSLFTQAKKNNNFVEKKDLMGAQYQILGNAFEMLDRNGDGKLTEAELDEYVTLLDGAKNAFASFKISEEGQDLFQILDVNKDGKLSQRELMNAWEVLSMLDRDKDGFISPEEFSQQYVLAVGQGQQVYYNNNFVVNNPGAMGQLQPGPAKSAKLGPLWFQKMDVNGDGDVSPREFLGSKELFQKMDLNGDGLIDAEEAWKADEWFGKKKNK
jgi:Ca2+-binding EF-hand superfamily protein